MSLTSDSSSPGRRQIRDGPYDLRPLVEDVPLSVDGVSSIITCVDYLDDHLYIGTSAGEVLHFVSIPGDPVNADDRPTFILAARLSPSPSSSTLPTRGAQQIVLLPEVSKACILCNNTLTFYSLPELSPAFGNKIMSNCSWIGSRDLNGPSGSRDGSPNEGEGVTIMVCVKNRIRMVRIGEEPRLVKNIEYPGCLASVRRGRFAAVANERSYALLDIDHQQKIPLFSISSAEEASADAQREGITSTAPAHRTASGQVKSDSAGQLGIEHIGHGRSSSLGAFVSGLGRRQQESRSRSRERHSLERSGLETPIHDSIRPASPARVNEMPLAISSPRSYTPDKPLPPAPEESPPPAVSQFGTVLPPHICSPLSTEFLLTTGTRLQDPGVGIFVNCDGDVVRGTLEFSRYPEALVVDGGKHASTDGHDGYVLAAMTRAAKSNEQTPDEHGIEIQRWDLATAEKYWLPIGSETLVGVGTTTAAAKVPFSDTGHLLRSRRFHLFNETQHEPDWELRRNQQEDDFSRRLGHSTTNIIAWAGSSVYWMARNPPLLKWNAMLDQILLESADGLNQDSVLAVSSSIRGHEAKNETEFLSLRYIRQKISLILFAELAANRYEVHPQIDEHVLLEGELDPRVVLSMIPLLRANVVEGSKGIWIHAGLITLLNSQLSTRIINLESDEVFTRPEEFDLVGLVKRYLMAWRQRKGFGSVPDEASVFASVDASLLHILLFHDQQSLAGPGRTPSVRAELYAIVDEGVECFDRAVELLERHHRLYVLSRLYQSRKLIRHVLATWRRIIEGDQDDGGELIDGENEVRKYLVRIRDSALVEEYGAWLARRNPSLGVLVFSDDHGRVKLPPNHVVQLLRLKAPNAVKVYLEHLVFGKKNVQYASNLISYYLDNVLHVLATSEQARSMLADSYLKYRALDTPKPTYRQFVMQYTTEEPWWHDRLRLLELIGGTHGADFSYDISNILERIEPFEAALIPESIILDGRQGRHEQALRLLTHGLGDYHTAINYCLLGGSSIYYPVAAGIPSAPSRDEQVALFQALFLEFLSIHDVDDRLEQTSTLLEHFGSWYDVTLVLKHIPDEWSVQLISAFLFGAFRRLIYERDEAMMVKALSGAENLKMSVDFLDKCADIGPAIEAG